MGLFQRIGLWYLIVYLIGANCVSDIDKNKQRNGSIDNNNISKNHRNINPETDIVITLSKHDVGDDCNNDSNDVNISGNSNSINDGGIEFDQIGGTKFISCESILHCRQYNQNCGRDSWGKDEVFWRCEGVIGTTFFQGCMFFLSCFVCSYYLFVCAMVTWFICGFSGFYFLQ